MKQGFQVNPGNDRSHTRGLVPDPIDKLDINQVEVHIVGPGVDMRIDVSNHANIDRPGPLVVTPRAIDITISEVSH